jgi:heme peroxidase
MREVAPIARSQLKAESCRSRGARPPVIGGLSRTPLFARLTGWAAATTRWAKLPWSLGLVTISIYRNWLRRENLHDTESSAAKDVPPSEDRHYLTARTADGTYCDLENPRMSSAGTRFGRNVPIDRTHPDNERLMRPKARTFSRELLRRETFLPAESLNLLAAAWIQFMLRDWLSHGKSPNEMVRSSWLRR